jgi:hypothetical protein
MPTDELEEIINTQIQKDFTFRSVSKAVNAVRNNSADLIVAV